VFFVNWDTALGNSNDQRNDQSVAAYYRVINGDALRNVRELVMGTVRASTEAPFNMPDRQPSNSMLLGALYHDWQTYRIGQVRLTSAHREKMAALVRHVQHIATENSEITIHILGFADKEGGSDLVNQAFSWARVRVCQKEILQYLRSVDSDIQNHIKISMYWYGNYASSRIFANYPNRELSYNRRIELIVSDKADWENVSRIRMFEKSWQSTEGHDRFDNLSVWPEPPWPKSIESEGLKFEELLLDHESNRGRPR